MLKLLSEEEEEKERVRGRKTAAAITPRLILLPSSPLNLQRTVQRCPKETGHLIKNQMRTRWSTSSGFLLVTGLHSTVCRSRVEGPKQMGKHGVTSAP